MSISGALNNALSGLTVNARMAETVSNNLSNSLTDGYGVRSLELSAGQTGGAGGGVRVISVNRFVDAGILADRRLADAALGGEERSAETLTRLQQTLGGPEDAFGLSARLSQFEQALISASSDPGSETRLANVVSRLNDVTDTLNANTKSIQAFRQDADASIARDIEVLNSSLLQIEEMNGDILRIRSSGGDTSTVLDSRQKVVDQIAEIVPVREVVRENGTIGLMTTTGTTLVDGQTVQFGFNRTPTITADMELSGGLLSGITLDGVALDSTIGIGRLDGGSLGAAFALRDATLVEAQQSLDGIAADLAARLQDPNTDPTLAAGDVGLLTDYGGVMDPADTIGLAGRISVNASVDPLQGGSAQLLRDGLNAAAPGPIGDATQINRWVTVLDTPRADISGAAERSAAGRVADFVAQVGSARLVAEEKLSYTSARWDSLKQAELAGGVDTDLELQNLLRIEQAYAANTKVIHTVDFMMQRLMEI